MSSKEIFPESEPEELIEIALEHSQAYNIESEPLPVKFTEETSCITPDGNIMLNPINAWKIAEELDLTEEEAIRHLLNVLSHEVEHYNQSDLESKKEFTREYPKAPKIAGAVMNIVEDCYIDNKRLERFEGLRKPFKEATEAKIENINDIDPSNLADACIRTVTYVFRTGEKPDNLKTEFLQEFADLCIEKRRETIKADKQEERVDIANELTATIINELDPEEPPEIVEEFLEELKEAVKLAEKEFEIMSEEEKEELEEEIEEMAEEIGAELPNEEELEELEEESDESESGSSGSGSSEGDSETDSDGSSGETGSSHVDTTGEEDDPTEETGSSSGSTGKSGESDEDSEKDSEEGSERGSESESEEDSEEEESEEESKDGKTTSEDVKSDSSDNPDVEEETEEEEDDDVKEFDIEKFRNPDIRGGTESVKPAKMSTIKGDKLKSTKSDAKSLSDDIKETLEQMKDKQDNKKTINTTKGTDLDIKKSIRYMSGDKSSRDVYRKEVRDEPDNRAIGMTIDASGSMRGKEMDHALQACGAIGKASKILGDDFISNTHWSDVGKSTEKQDTGVSWITRMGEEFEMDDLEGVKTRYREPIALGIRKTREELEKSDKNGDRVIFVVHDGNPTITAEGKPYKERGICEEAIDEIQEEVKESRGLGYKVIGIAVGDAPDKVRLNQMFGNNGWFRFESDELAEKLLTIYRNQ